MRPAPVSPRALEALREGVQLDDGPTAPARVRQVAPGCSRSPLREGRKRQVRRMCEAVGHRVVELERVAFGPLGLRGLGPAAAGGSRTPRWSGCAARPRRSRRARGELA